MRLGISSKRARPLLIPTLLLIEALWMVANIGYRTLLPALGIDLSYNASPLIIAAYFGLWTLVSVYLFWDYFLRWLPVEHSLWVYIFICAVFTACSWFALSVIAQISVPSFFSFSLYSDLQLSTPWYFVPKFTELLFQQVLIAALVLMLYAYYRSLNLVILAYAVFFGGAHVLFFIIKPDVPTVHATVMTIGSVLSALIFPRLILRVKSGFVYSFMIHFAFYIILALIFHSWSSQSLLW